MPLKGMMRKASNTDEIFNKPIYDEQYWQKKVETLIKEKKSHLEENNKAHTHLYKL